MSPCDPNQQNNLHTYHLPLGLNDENLDNEFFIMGILARALFTK